MFLFLCALDELLLQLSHLVTNRGNDRLSNDSAQIFCTDLCGRVAAGVWIPIA